MPTIIIGLALNGFIHCTIAIYFLAVIMTICPNPDGRRGVNDWVNGFREDLRKINNLSQLSRDELNDRWKFKDAPPNKIHICRKLRDDYLQKFEQTKV